MATLRIEDPKNPKLFHEVDVADDATPEDLQREEEQFLSFLVPAESTQEIDPIPSPESLQLESMQSQLTPEQQGAFEGIEVQDIQQGSQSLGGGGTFFDIPKHVGAVEVQDDNSILARAIKNTPKSAVNFASDMANAAVGLVNPNDPSTWRALAGLSQEALGFMAGRHASEFNDTVYLKAIADNLEDRYGSLESLEETIATDPVGFASDVLGAVSLASGAAKNVVKGASVAGGKAGWLSAKQASHLGLLEEGLRKFSRGTELMDPATWATGAGKKMLKGTSKGAGALAESMLSRQLHFTKGRVKKIMKFTGGRTPARWLLDNEVWGGPSDMQTKLAKIKKDGMTGVDDAIDRIMQKPGVRLYGTDSVPSAGFLVDDMLDELKNVRAKEALPRIRKLQGYKSRLEGGYATLKDVQDMKRMAARHNTKISKAFEGPTQGGSVRQVARNSAEVEDVGNLYVELKDFIEDEAKALGEPNIGKLNNDVQVASALDEAIFDATVVGASNKAFGLRDLLLLGYGEPMLGASLMFGKKILEIPTVKSKMVKTINRLSPVEIDKSINAMRTGDITEASQKVGSKLKGAIVLDAAAEMAKLNRVQERAERENRGKQGFLNSLILQ